MKNLLWYLFAGTRGGETRARIINILKKNLNAQLNTKQEVKMVKKDNEVDFEFDEEKALKEAFAEARQNGKLFNADHWKMNREKQRAKLNLPTSDQDD